VTAPVFPFGETLILVSKTVAGWDSDGNDRLADVRTTVPRCPVWQESSSELIQGQDTVITRTVAVLPKGTDVSAIDGIEWNGGSYKVDGDPAVFTSPFTGLTPGVVVQLEKVGG